jgi:hypothetical protein
MGHTIPQIQGEAMLHPNYELDWVMLLSWI